MKKASKLQVVSLSLRPFPYTFPHPLTYDASFQPPPQKAPELSLGKPKRRFVLKTQSSSSQKYKRSRPSGNSNVPAEDCGSSETRKDVGDGTLPQESMGGEAEAGLKSDSFQARDRKQTGHGGCDQGDIGTAAGHNRTSDEQSGDESRVGLLTVASSTAARPPEREDGGVSTGEAGAGDDEDKRQEADPNPEREDGKASSPGQQVSANEYMNAASPGADARPAGEGHAEDEEDKDSAPPDVTVTANFVGQLKKGARYRRKRWKLELEGGAIETSESVFVFDKCECTFYSPWKH